jgi:hypothetical protein
MTNSYIPTIVDADDHKRLFSGRRELGLLLALKILLNDEDFAPSMVDVMDPCQVFFFIVGNSLSFALQFSSC